MPRIEGVANPRNQAGTGDLWPGITRGHDARCSCSWAPGGRGYEVKARDRSCLNHGGPLDAVLSRMARWRQEVS